MKSPNPLNKHAHQIHMQPTFTHSWPYQWIPNYYTPAPMVSNTFGQPNHHESLPHGLSNHVTHLSSAPPTQTPNLGMSELLMHFIESP